MKNCFTQKKSENVRPHYSQSSHENATASSDTSLLASYKEVPRPPPGGGGYNGSWTEQEARMGKLEID